YGSCAGAPPDISKKRRNRLTLKYRLLKEVWGEDIMEKERDFKIEIGEEVRELMDKRMILEEDLLAVMESYNENGEAVYDAESGLLTARKRIGNVTFWVKFTEEGGVYKIAGAYRHRMTVETR
ncbi:MAG: aldehyde dehydrogenase, partial [Oscillospiraceae bacterium]|nr:aldehyde dehydrogenase [Oscillospiraceae bacterium]